MNVTVGDELTELRRLLHDPNDNFWSQEDKVANLNKAIRRRDNDTGANRLIEDATLTAGQDEYDIATLSGNSNVFDVVGVYLINAGTRRLLDNYSYTRLTTMTRMWVTATMEPIGWAKLNPTTIFLGPAPGIAYDVELDCCQEQGSDLTTSDNDPLPYPFTEPVPYYAAYLCKVNQRQFPEANAFREMYFEALRTIEAGKAGMLPSGYPIIGR